MSSRRAAEFRTAPCLDVALSGQDLAEMAATTPYTVSRIFATWRRRHLVDVS